MKAIITLAIALTAAFGFSSCASRTHAQHQAGQGALAGAIVGGIIGHQSGERNKGALLGGLIGAVAGHATGHKKDQQVKQQNQPYTPAPKKNYYPYTKPKQPAHNYNPYGNY